MIYVVQGAQVKSYIFLFIRSPFAYLMGLLSSKVNRSIKIKLNLIEERLPVAMECIEGALAYKSPSAEVENASEKAQGMKLVKYFPSEQSH